MQHFIFKHTGNKKYTGTKVVGAIVLFLFGLCCIFYSTSGSNNLGVIGSFLLIGVSLILSAFYLVSFSLGYYGLIVKDGKLSTATFLFGSVYTSEVVDISNVKGIDILKFGYRGSNQDSDHIRSDLTFTDYKVFMLNESHSKRKLICQTLEKEEAELVTQFLIDKLGIQRVKYNPPAARRRKRRR